MITRQTCPVCNSTAISQQLVAEDYTVSHQPFAIWQCLSCTLRFTQAVPDAASVGAYYQSDNYISHTNSQQGFINRLYHYVRRSTLKKKLRLLRHITGLRTGHLLDIGAGTGAFAGTMHQAGWQVTGLEPDAATRERALALHGITLASSDQLFQLPAGSFDAITLWHVLEHVHELHAYIEQAKILLKEKGRLLIAVPNYIAYDAAVYCQYWAAYDVPRHLYHFSPAAMKNLLQQHQLQLLDVQPMWYDSFYISLLSSRYKSGKTNLPGAFLTGLISNIKAMFNKEKCSSVLYVIAKSH